MNATVKHSPGPSILIGDYPEPGTVLALTDPWGNESHQNAGAKPAHGPGGFEFLLHHRVLYELTDGADTWAVLSIQDRTATVVFEVEQAPAPEPAPEPTPKPTPEPEPVPVEPEPPKLTLEQWDELWERLGRVVVALEAMVGK